MNLTWRCQICKKERPDNKISVVTYPMRGLPSAEVNIKYCNDNMKCYRGALEKRKRGELK